LTSNTVATELMKKFNIKILPTFLFFDEEGNPVHKFCNTNFPKSILLEQAKLAFDKDLRYYALIKKFENGNRSPSFFKELFNALKIAKDTTDGYLSEFIKSRDNLFTSENAMILMQSYSHRVALDYLFNNKEIWEKVISKDTLERFYKNSVYKYVSDCFYFAFNSNVNADSLIEVYEKQYPHYGKNAVSVILFRQWGNANSPKRSRFNYLINTYFDSSLISQSTSEELNSYAWSIFLVTEKTDTTILNKGLLWSRRSLEQDKDNPLYLDTYANLLYKLGRTKEAIEIENQALDMAELSKRKIYEETIYKMKNGRSTWK
ncbi:MAG: hypothetical protein ACOVO1_00295, partial [Chitinophagaceae bacterium]